MLVFEFKLLAAFFECSVYAFVVRALFQNVLVILNCEFELGQGLVGFAAAMEGF